MVSFRLSFHLQPKRREKQKIIKHIHFFTFHLKFKRFFFFLLIYIFFIYRKEIQIRRFIIIININIMQSLKTPINVLVLQRIILLLKYTYYINLYPFKIT